MLHYEVTLATLHLLSAATLVKAVKAATPSGVLNVNERALVTYERLCCTSKLSTVSLDTSIEPLAELARECHLSPVSKSYKALAAPARIST